MKIIPITYARSVIPESMAFRHGAKDKKLPIDFIIYYVETCGRRILIDAGCDTMPGFEMQDFVGPVKALQLEGIDACDITDVVLTHAHHDHIEGVRHFSNAVIHIQKDEYAIGKNYIPEGFAVNTFDEELELCDNFKVLKIGGHSVGSCIVEIVDGDKICVVCGDECYVRRCLTERIPTGASYCRANSEKFVKKYSDPKYTVLLCHEK